MRPSLKVVDPIPDPLYFDLLTINSLHLTNVFSLDESDVLFTVQDKVAFPVLERPEKVISLKFTLNDTCALVKTSFCPVSQVKM